MVELWCPEVWAHVTGEFPVLFNAAFPNSKKCPIFTLNWEFAGGGLVGGWISLYYLALGKIDLAICKNQFFYLSLAGWWFASSWEKSFWEHLADVTQSLDIWMATAKVRAAKMKSSLDAMACGSAVILKVLPAPCHIAPPTLKGAFVDSAVCSVPGHGWGSHAVDCTKVLASTRNHDSLPVAIEWKHFVCLVAVKLEAVQSHAILAGCCKRTPN